MIKNLKQIWHIITYERDVLCMEEGVILIFGTIFKFVFVIFKIITFPYWVIKYIKEWEYNADITD